MNDKTLKELLKRFMDGDTTLDEEARLTKFFRKATDNDKPQGIADDDWLAYREMFRKFDNDFATPAPPKARRKPLWAMLSAAAAILILAVCMATLSLNRGNETETQMAAMTEQADSTKTDTIKVRNVETMPTKTEKPRRLRRLPCTPQVPRNLIAESETPTMTREDSLLEAMREVEAVVAAMTAYQELKISEICNVEYEEEY